MNPLSTAYETYKKYLVPDALEQTGLWKPLDAAVAWQQEKFPSAEDRRSQQSAQQVREETALLFVEGSIVNLAEGLIRLETVIDPELQATESEVNGFKEDIPNYDQYVEKLTAEKEAISTVVSLFEKDPDGKLLLEAAKECKLSIEKSPERRATVSISQMAKTDREIVEMKQFIVDTYAEAAQIHESGHTLVPANTGR